MPRPAAIASLLLSAVGLGAAVDFDREIRPLLEERCVECHSAKKTKANLRLDARPHALKGGESGPAFVAGDPAKSPLYQRIVSQDEDERMPPKGDRLTPAQAEKMRRWIAEGAVWPENAADRAALRDPRLDHWSVQPVRNDQPADASIDGYVGAALRAKGLTPAPAADRRTLIRRLHFDLLGLPPSPERTEKFAQGRDPADYERLVDELLASPHYGERWARHWLDIAHYADTHGFERDQLRPNAWRYRDYVIDAFNADKPFDRFILEQVAGDVLVPGDPTAVVATGFLAAGPWDFVGHVETRSDVLKRAARAGDLDDIVTQVMTSTMAVTVNCARCHDHKLDPIGQKEYYSLWSVFAGVRRADRDMDEAASRRLAGEKARLGKELAQARAGIARLTGEGLRLAGLLPAGSGIDVRNGTVTREKQGYHHDLQVNRLQKVEGVPGVKWVFIPDGKGEVTVDLKTPVKGVPATSGHFWDVIANRPLNLQRSTVLDGRDHAGKGQSMLGMHANCGITFDLAKLRELGGMQAARLVGTVGFGAQKEAAGTRADFSVFVDAELRFQKLRLRKDETAVLDVDIPAQARTLTLIATDGGDGIGSDLLFVGNPRLVPSVAETELTDAAKSELNRLRETVRRNEAALAALPDPAKVYAFTSEKLPPAVKVQRRGNPEDTGVEVMPGAFGWAGHAPAAFGDNAMEEGARRLALARWITDPANPLTARVAVNRLWHHHFGQGIVATPSDFGTGGDRPSHPELLDFLARELVRGGWSLKRIHRLILLSDAYRRSSVGGDPRGREVDSANRLLWRQNPRRLDAESLRDAVLSVSGKLNLERGGPGFRDFRYTEAYAPVYDYVTPDRPELWRRSIYRFVVRTTPHRFMSTLDCPDPANLTPARTRTTTALQALALSNNDFMLRQAQYLAERVEHEAPDLDGRIGRAFELCFQRGPDEAELRAARGLVVGQNLFMLCRMLLNANEFVHVD